MFTLYIQCMIENLEAMICEGTRVAGGIFAKSSDFVFCGIGYDYAKSGKISFSKKFKVCDIEFLSLQPELKGLKIIQTFTEISR
jgi:hypothetical protein